MRNAVVGVVLVATAAPASPSESVTEVHRTLREIESSILRGEVGAKRIAYQELVRKRPGDVMARVYLAWCEMPSDEAWNQLKGIASIYPDQPWARLGMGRVYLRWKMRDQAANEFNAALKSNPRFHPALVGLGEVARAGGDVDGAEQRYRDALAIAPDDPEAYAGLGLALLARGASVEAKMSLARAIELWPDQPTVLAELSRIARDEKDLASATKWAEKVADLSPRNAQARRALADLRFEAGDKKGAAVEYDLAVRLGVVDTEVQRRLAAIHRELGNAEAEQRALEQLSVLEKKVPDHAVRLSELAEARGDAEAAEAQLLEALDRAPEQSDIHLRLARLRVKRDQLRDALDSYRLALAKAPVKSPEVESEATALVAKFKLPRSPANGSVDAIYVRVSSNLNTFYGERLKAKPGLKGKLAIRVRVNNAGKVEGADVISDTVGDPWLVGHAYFQLKDATYPPKKREPIFEFELKPPKGK